MELARGGATVQVESQNSFQYRRPGGVTLAGKPDIVALDDTTATVVDCKTGRPKISDQIQVQIYMYVLPICFPRLALYGVHGRVVYPDHQVEIAATAADEHFGKHLDYFLELIASDSPPMSAASPSECRFCDITRDDCPERVEGAALAQLQT
jgi:PD-(D/E)XK nuclease superfamily